MLGLRQKKNSGDGWSVTTRTLEQRGGACGKVDASVRMHKTKCDASREDPTPDALGTLSLPSTLFDLRCTLQPQKKKVDQWLGPCRVRWHGEAAMWTARLDSAEWGQTGQDASLIGTSLKTEQRRNSEAGAGFSQNLDLRTSRHKRHQAHSGFNVNPVDAHCSLRGGSVSKAVECSGIRGVRWRELRFDVWASFSALSDCWRQCMTYATTLGFNNVDMLGDHLPNSNGLV